MLFEVTITTRLHRLQPGASLPLWSLQEGLAALSSDEAAGTPAHVFTYCALTAHAARYPSGRGVGGPWRPVLTTGQHAGRLLGGSGKAPQDAKFTNFALVLAAIQQDKTRHRSSMRSEVRTPEWICPCARSNRAGQGQYGRCTCSHSNSAEQDSGGLCTCHWCVPE